MTDPLGNLFVTRMQQLEIAMLGRVLATTLAQALPAHMVTVQRRRPLADRLRGMPAHVSVVTVHAGEQELLLRSGTDGRVETEISHVVRGIVLSRRTVAPAEWLHELGAVLDRAAAQDAATRRVLRRALID